MSRRVLIVDDCADIRLLLYGLFKAQGFSAAIACDGDEAWEILRNHDRDFEVVVIDLQMPKMDGLTLIRTFLRQHLWFPTVILYTTTALDNADIAEIKAEIPIQNHFAVVQKGAVASLDLLRRAVCAG